MEAGSLVAELMLEKTQMEIDAPASGIIHIHMPTETPVQKGDVIATVETP